MKPTSNQPSGSLRGKTARFILDPDAKSTITAIHWRWGDGPDQHTTHPVQVGQEADSLRALALAMLAAELWNQNPTELEALGTMRAGIVRGWWTLRPAAAGKNLLQTLGITRDVKAVESPLSVLL
ncbi:MAG: hypothetical protein ACKO3N_00310, partial [Verrucomicrobiota bacterium]